MKIGVDRPPVTLDDLGERLFATVPEVAAITRVDERIIRKAIRDGGIPGIKAGYTYRVPVAWLRRAVAGEPSGSVA